MRAALIHQQFSPRDLHVCDVRPVEGVGRGSFPRITATSSLVFDNILQVSCLICSVWWSSSDELVRQGES